MLMIRLQRTGRKHEPTFRLVLTDSKNSTKSGKFQEVLGNYDSRRGEQATFNTDRIKYWMSVGAQPSDTVHNLLIDKKIISAKKINKLPKKSAPKKEEPTVQIQSQPEAPAVEETSAAEVSAEPAAEISVETSPETTVEEASTA